MSNSTPAASAWSPYSVLPPTTRRKLEKKFSTATEGKALLALLGVPPAVAKERLAGHFVHLTPPEGKVSEQRQKELAKREDQRKEKKRKRAQDASCGLVGRRRRKADKEAAMEVSYDAILAVHKLWLSYIAELLGLPILVEPAPPADAGPSTSSSFLLPTFPSKRPDPGVPTAAQLDISVQAFQTKLLKAEFVGCLLSVKRAKNPSLVGLTGIVLQETQGTLKIVTSKSAVKVIPKANSIFNLKLPLVVPPAAQGKESSREISFDIYGDAFGLRGPDRVGKKWKAGGGSGGVELM